VAQDRASELGEEALDEVQPRTMLGRAMDNDKGKSAIEKMIDKVNDAVECIANTASAAAMKAMEPEPDPKQVAGTTSEQVYIPEATDAAAGPAPLFAAPAKKKRALPKTTAVKAAAPKKSAKKSTT
jgi:hypothetical protein